MVYIPIITLSLVIIATVLLILLFKRLASNQNNNIFSVLESKISTLDNNIKSDFSNNRSEIDRKISELTKNLLDINNEFRREITENLKASINELSIKLKEDLKDNKETISNSLDKFSENLNTNIDKLNNIQKENFSLITTSLEATKESINNTLLSIRDSVDNKLKDIQENNSKKLEEMRVTVDEKLHKTLEERLGQSFTQVSERLEAVQLGLGEMKGIASNVGDLKKVLTNVKTAGNLGEYQLSTILGELLSEHLYYTQYQIKKDSLEKVDFAVKIPSKNGTVDGKEYIILPIDSKFPITDYEKLIEAYDTSNKEIIASAQKELEKKIKSFADDIKKKYINEPYTTNFAIMFLPFEGLYAEALKIPNLLTTIQEKYNVTLAGPSTIVAFINSLQMGFKTLAIQKKSGEIYELLGNAKTEFTKFAEQIDKVRKNITEAGNNLEKIGTRSRAVERTLKKVDLVDYKDKDPFEENLLEIDVKED